MGSARERTADSGTSRRRPTRTAGSSPRAIRSYAKLPRDAELRSNIATRSIDTAPSGAGPGRVAATRHARSRPATDPAPVPGLAHRFFSASLSDATSRVGVPAHGEEESDGHRAG